MSSTRFKGLAMKFSLKKIWSTPYPFYFRGRSLWYFSLIIFLLAFLFNYLFTPFHVNTAEHRMDYLWISVIHSFMPVVVLLLLCPFTYFFPSLEEHWTIGKDVLFLSLFLLLIGVGQFLIRDLIYNNPNNWSWGYLKEEISNTFLVGTLLVGIIISVNFNRLNAHHIREANLLQRSRKSIGTNPYKSIIPIETQVKLDRFNLEVEKFLFAKAEGNYLVLHMHKDDSLTKVLKRITIKEFEKQVGVLDQIVRTHRSFIVNLAYLEQVKGNAQGYQLKLENCAIEIPVSRNMIPSFEARLKK